MSLCINPNCPSFPAQNQDTRTDCRACGSLLLFNGRYRATRMLGSGGFGMTFEVSDSENPRTMKVLKVLTNDHPKALYWFRKEAEVLQRLNHPGIPKAEEEVFPVKTNQDQELYCLVMEKIDGCDLYQYLANQNNQPIDQDLALKWLGQIAEILAEVHRQRFFHRDIKPSNIMVRTDGQLVLIDFGTVRQLTPTYVDSLEQGRVTKFSSGGYTAPEQQDFQAVPQSDFFSLGRTFVYLLTGKEPTELYDSRTGKFRWRDSANNISPQFADLLDRLMAKNYRKRPGSPTTILQQLQKIEQTLASHSNSPQSPSTVVAPDAIIVVNKKWAVAGGGLLLTLVLGFGSYQFISGQNAIEEPPTATPTPTPTPTPPPPPPPPTITDEAWKLARIKASIAGKLTKDAKTKADWEKVASEWEEVIELLKQVPESSDNYERAQQRIDTYQKVVEYAKSAAK